MDHVKFKKNKGFFKASFGIITFILPWVSLLKSVNSQGQTLSPGAKPLGRFEGLGPLGNTIEFLTVQTPLSLLNKVVSITIGFITLVAFLYFMFQFFTAGLSWVTAGGDAKKTEAAGKQITNGIIGMVIVVSAIFIIDLLGKVLGIDILNPFGFIIDIW